MNSNYPATPESLSTTNPPNNALPYNIHPHPHTHLHQPTYNQPSIHRFHTAQPHPPRAPLPTPNKLSFPPHPQPLAPADITTTSCCDPPITSLLPSQSHTEITRRLRHLFTVRYLLTCPALPLPGRNADACRYVNVGTQDDDDEVLEARKQASKRAKSS